jgi:hypothetical protein
MCVYIYMLHNIGNMIYMINSGCSLLTSNSGKVTMVIILHQALHSIITEYIILQK